MSAPTVSLVVPCYNEEANIVSFLAAVRPVLDGLGEPYEIVFVDDGSRDGTLPLIVAAASKDPAIKVVGLARNFGKDIALSAGLAHARGQAVIPIDSDLQHPPELIATFVEKWKGGVEMVIGVRKQRDEEGWLRRTLSRAFYRVLGRMTSVKIPPSAGDYRLMDRKIVDVLNAMPERCRFMKGLYAWPGFSSELVEFQAHERSAGKSNWSFWKLWNFALDGLFSFSRAPLQIWTYVGLFCAFGAFVYLAITLVQKFAFGIDAPGYASVLSVLLFFNGVTLISNGILGEYVARIFDEVKGRPLYVVAKTWGIEAAAPARPALVVDTSGAAAASTPTRATP